MSVLLGATKYVLRNTKKIFFELNGALMKKRGQKTSEMLRLLDDFGFRIYAGTRGDLGGRVITREEFETVDRDKRITASGQDMYAVRRDVDGRLSKHVARLAEATGTAAAQRVAREKAPRSAARNPTSPKHKH